jgi:hypothetical protein
VAIAHHPEEAGAESGRPIAAQQNGGAGAIITDVERELYPAASSISARLVAYFRHRIAAGNGSPEDVAALPDAPAIEALIDVAFWASLRREEGLTPRISLAFLAPEARRRPLIFERPLPLRPDVLARVSPAVERQGIHLGVWRDANELLVWGTTRIIPPHCFVLEVSAPGLLVIKHQSADDSGKFINVAVLEGEQIKMVDERASNMPGCPALLTSLLGSDSPGSWGHSVNVLVQLAVSMRGHGRGGLLVVIPAGSEAWRESIVQPIGYAVSPPFAELARLTGEPPHQTDRRLWQDMLGRAVDELGGLTAVDGAMVLTDRYELLGFGAKIGRRKGWAQVERVRLTEPVEGGRALVIHPDELGGTRHLAAAQFVHDQRDAVALVASQDGRFTVLEWSACEDMVCAHRIEALLL